jgi:hypothetical protein
MLLDQHLEAADQIRCRRTIGRDIVGREFTRDEADQVGGERAQHVGPGEMPSGIFVENLRHGRAHRLGSLEYGRLRQDALEALRRLQHLIQHRR